MRNIKSKLCKVGFVFTAMVAAMSVSVSAATFKKTVNVKKHVPTVKVTMEVGDKLKLKVKDGNKTVTTYSKYSTSKKKVATVKKGVIKAVKKGTSVITVKYNKKAVKVKLVVIKAPKYKDTKDAYTSGGRAETKDTGSASTSGSRVFMSSVDDVEPASTSGAGKDKDGGTYSTSGAAKDKDSGTYSTSGAAKDKDGGTYSTSGGRA